MFVCLCKVVTDGQVEEAIDNGARTVAEVGEACEAGAGCGACHEQIQDMIDRSQPSAKSQGSGGASDCRLVQISVTSARQ